MNGNLSPPKTPDWGSWLAYAEAQLASAGIGTARLDAQILLSDAAGQERSQLLAHPREPLEAALQKKLAAQLKRRMRHEPLAYIRGFCDFYGRRFIVNKQVLVPRPESETMIELLKQLPLPGKIALADIGSGSGALGITAALELPGGVQPHLYDIDPATLVIARRNARQHRVSAACFEADLLTPDHESYDVILANLPYVPDRYTINEAALIEPKIAIFGGDDGLDLYRRLFAQLSQKPWQPHYILTESLPFQHRDLQQIATRHSFVQVATSDFIQVFAPAG